jgi:hypothetical protein
MHWIDAAIIEEKAEDYRSDESAEAKNVAPALDLPVCLLVDSQAPEP